MKKATENAEEFRGVRHKKGERRKSFEENYFQFSVHKFSKFMSVEDFRVKT
jgi:hypothetical protein